LAFLFPEEKARRLERSWADMFQARALPLIDEERFAMMYWKKDVLKSMIFMTFALSVMLYIGTYMAPFVTQSAVEMGIEIPAGVTYVSSLMFPGVYAVLGVFIARLLTGA